MAAAGLQRLADMQLSDGGWGWFSGYRRIRLGPHDGPGRPRPASRPRATTSSLPRGDARAGRRLAHGLPGQAGPVARERRQRGQAVQAVRRRHRRAGLHGPDRCRSRATTGCSASWIAIARSSRSTPRRMFGLGLERLGEKEKLAAVLQNIGQYVVRDDENQTAYLKLPNEGYWWWWYGSEIETDAFYLKLLARTDPEGRAGAAAGEVRAQQPPARQLLELDPRHGLLHRGPGRLLEGQRRGPARHDGHDRDRRPDAARK